MASPEEIRSELDKILNSRSLNGSDQLKRLLRVIVERTLSGEAESVKEYTLGVEAFGRAADFDPKVDPIVRVQARRLRAKLEEFYAAEGASDPVRISIPKGGYLPTFSSGANTLPSWRRRMPMAFAAAAVIGVVVWFVPAQKVSADPTSIAVLPFRNLTGDPDKQYIADKTTEGLLTELGRVRSLHVVSGTTTRRFADSQQTLPAIARELGVRWVVEGGAGFECGEVLLKIRLVDSTSDHKVWANAFTSSLDSLSFVQAKAASEIANALEKVGSAKGIRTPI